MLIVNDGDSNDEDNEWNYSERILFQRKIMIIN